jgi:hypothetical protein
MNAKLLVAMGVVFCVSFAALVHAEPIADAAVLTYYSYPPWDSRYVSAITQKMLDSSPDWADSEPNPPVSARKAMLLAEATLQKVLKDNVVPAELKRELTGVKLIPREKKKWYWEVSYEWHRRWGGETGTPARFHVLVLMDGKVVQAEKQEWNGAEE